MLLELTNKEKELQGLGVKVTLKEIADKYGKEHKHLKRDFNLMISRLSEEEKDQTKFGQISYLDSYNRKQETIEMDFVTTIWFIAKFDESLRLKIVLYAVNKFKEEKNLELEQKDKLLEDKNKEVDKLKEENEKLKEQVKKKQQKFNDYGIKDYATISRFLEEINEFNYKNRDKLFYILTLNNIITYEKVCYFKSKIIDDKIGKLMSVKHNDNQRLVEMFEKGKLYELWNNYKHITIPNKEEWREIVKDKI